MEADAKMTELSSAVLGTRGYRVDPSTLFPWSQETRNGGSTIY